ncbi:oxygen-independent coproporphyrinogen III oxidase [Moraxella bovis]|uniref:Coproporphyrinogen-III oxidase n=1 Tax=Moraxella bovis TaxID=476 RepID=A0AAQ2Q8X2_MORBO|nr:oxygen-independent coproporphyrinogen III oxidase [Moraxella bovis]UYZ75918.1 oxygen-independent coproporphyrinogen III oxidase [Moraxella bovis]UYZ78141.1 oxygen-independent coproporphyrinogen III oxidase [Moraxella bovis]UYZ86624.1 oxygen-independent coproporphyrinogen III oxidase [Moraxella bovis]UYZ92048.1 oxygen-independent coproporphyrinogen III oxidase [Moraxella bovis]UYZ98033.1 oxygen-independent coproporphyrinogen III oxidase [Moraxella bovis]
MHHFSQVSFDEALIQKYNRQGPRYTSYPTVLEFAPILDGVEMSILQQKDPAVPLSLYIHIPFCRHLCYYCGCNKIITKKNSDSGDYLDYLFREIRHKKSLLNGNAKVKQVHLGGGTPTFLSDDELTILWRFLQDEFDFADDGDYSVEIDPRELRQTTLAVLRSLGVNRLSFGVQDLDETVQIVVNRVQPHSMVQAVMREARELGFGSINIDLIYGLPHQSVASMADTVAKIIALAPDRLSVFNYAHLPERFTAQRRIKDDDLPSPADKLTMFGNIIKALTDAGYQYIGIDHFARPDDDMAIAQRQGKLHRNFQGYAILGECDLLSFGVSSISQIGEHILQNPTDLTEYQARINDGTLPAIKHIKADDKDKLRRYVIMNLLCHDRLDFADVDERFGIDSRRYFEPELANLHQMAEDGLVFIDEGGVQILPKGRILGRNVAMVFDEYLTQKHSGRFSKVI